MVVCLGFFVVLGCLL